MPTFGNILQNVPQGDTYNLKRFGFGIIPSLTLGSIKFWIKNGELDTDQAALFLSTITANPSLQGQITAYNPAEGTVQFNLVLPGVSSYAYTVIGTNNWAITWTSVNLGQQFAQLAVTYVVAGLNTTLSVVTTGSYYIFGATVPGNLITVNVATDNSGNPTSTGSQVLAAINADPTAKLLVQGVLASGSSGTDTVAAVAPQSLTYGATGTANYLANNPYNYQIVFIFTDGTQVVFEAGTIQVRAFTDTTLTTSLISLAKGSESGSARTDNIINVYVDSILEVFRSLRCWDMRGLRSGNDPNLVRFPYRRWNPSFTPEVYNAQNQAIPASNVFVDYDNGAIRVMGETGYEDYFATFQFDYFGVDTLTAFLNITLQELNLSGAEQRYLTSYNSVDLSPQSWDAPLAMGVCVKAFRRLAMDSNLWGGDNIWADPQGGRQLAMETATAMDATLSELKRGLKWGRFIARPTAAFDLFETVGFGFFAVAGSKWRGLELNTIAAM